MSNDTGEEQSAGVDSSRQGGRSFWYASFVFEENNRRSDDIYQELCLSTLDLVGDVLCEVAYLKRENAEADNRVRIALLFVARALTDLKCLRMCFQAGYLNQAGALGAAFWEHVVTACAFLAHEEMAREFAENQYGDLPWSNKEIADAAFGVVEAAPIYCHYRWFCQFKHVSAALNIIHRTTRLTPDQNIVMPVPSSPDQDKDIKGGLVLLCYLLVADLWGAYEKHTALNLVDAHTMKLKRNLELAKEAAIASADEFLSGKLSVRVPPPKSKRGP